MFGMSADKIELFPRQDIENRHTQPSFVAVNSVKMTAYLRWFQCVRACVCVLINMALYYPHKEDRGTHACVCVRPLTQWLRQLIARVPGLTEALQFLLVVQGKRVHNNTGRLELLPCNHNQFNPDVTAKLNARSDLETWVTTAQLS